MALFCKTLAPLSLDGITARAGIVSLAATVGLLAHAWSERGGYAGLADMAVHQLDLYAAGLESELSKYESLPSILELDENVFDLLEAPADSGLRRKVNKSLLNLNVRAGSLAILLMDAQGGVLAASDWYVLRTAQDELVEAGRLALLGQMSAAITHEINQPLTALRALSDNSLRLLTKGRMGDVERNLESIAKLTERMGRITAQLKSFARKAPPPTGSVRLAVSVANTLELLRGRIQAEGVDVCVEVPEGLRVRCDGHRLEQVLLNLCVNALDAMKDRPVRRLLMRAVPGSGSVRVSVADTGTGLTEAVMSKMFEPFFSTKPPGEGLGLGLVISSGIVREFGSSLRPSNLPDGASFEFDLELETETHHA